ncbi:MAG TPA: pyridoxal-dependent decarboxylase [Bryobacteraceae bacterium]|jgi:aromatic-L-amino-acid decarboxylase
MSPEEFRKAGHQVVDWLADYLSDPTKYPVLSRNRPGDLIDALPPSGPECGESWDQIFADFERQVVPAVTHWNHPGFMAYFANTASPPGILGEMLVAGLNTNGILWKSSPAVTELEQVALSWLRQWMGLNGEWFGIIHDTASTGVMHALAAARQAVAPEVRATGESAPLAMYCSEHAHSSVEKGALAIGVGQPNVRKIGADEKFRMRVDLLERAIEEDLKAGKKPICIVPTVGTTAVSSVDPVPDCAKIARRYGLWLHVDAAYAGSATVAQEYRWLLEGAESADSLITNPHKWLFTPVDLSVMYTRRPEVLRAAFSLIPEYLRTAENPRALNYMEYGIPLGRRFRALKLWFILRYYGHQKLAAMIREQISWAQELARQVEADPKFELAAPQMLSLVCLRYKGSDEENRGILDRVNESGEIFLSHASVNGRYVIRVAIGNMGTTRAHVQRAWELIRSFA